MMEMRIPATAMNQTPVIQGFSVTERHVGVKFIVDVSHSIHTLFLFCDFPPSTVLDNEANPILR
jgi:hypothetical protein